MPYRRNPATAVELLDLVLDFFGDGERWMKKRFGDGHGNRCLVGALRAIRHQQGIRGDGAGHYLRDAIPGLPEQLEVFNDRCRDFADVKALILRAREAAAKDATAMRVSEIEEPHIQAIAA